MNKEIYVKSLYDSIIKENLIAYEELFSNIDKKTVKDPYWKEALEFYEKLSNEEKNTLFKVIKQVQVDTMSNILGILDGVVTVEEDPEIKVLLNNQPIGGDLQNIFLEYDEENR